MSNLIPLKKYLLITFEYFTKPKTSLKVFTFCFFIVFIAQILSGRGLAFDGAYILYKMMITESFKYIETVRIMSDFFKQLPTWLFINFDFSHSISSVVYVFTFGLIWIHLISFLGCYFILPYNKKYLLLFPLLSFFTGPVIYLDMPISSSLSIHSYIWFVVFTIYYSKLLTRRPVFYFLIFIPLYLSHEMMSYIAWFLIYIQTLKVNTNTKKFYYLLSVLFLILCSILSFWFILFPTYSEAHNRNNFFILLSRLEFFIKIENGSFKYILLPSILSFLFLLLTLLQYFSRRFFKIVFTMFSLSIILFFVSFFITIEFFKTEEIGEQGRVYSPIIALPFSLIIWLLFERGKIKLYKGFFISCVMIAISLTAWRVILDYKFYKYQKVFSNKLLACKGILYWDDVFHPSIFKYSADHFKYKSSSLLYPRKLNIHVMLKTKTEHFSCYNSPPIGMCENNIDKNNKFFNFDKLYYYEKNGMSGC